MKRKNGAVKILITFIMTMITVAVAYMLGGLIWYLVGKFVINVFEINYNWTYMHGLATGILFSMLRDIFTIRVKD